jgi:hypothetical protein
VKLTGSNMLYRIDDLDISFPFFKQAFDAIDPHSGYYPTGKRYIIKEKVLPTYDQVEKVAKNNLRTVHSQFRFLRLIPSEYEADIAGGFSGKTLT